MALAWCTAAALPAANDAGQTTARSAILTKFLAYPVKPLTSYRARRHLEGHNLRFNKHGWLDVVTTLSPDQGFSYAVVGEGGSETVRKRALYAALDGEKEAVRAGRQSVVITEANYTFAEPVVVDGLAHVRITPKRKDKLLVDGWIFLNPDDGNLVELNGKLSKSPSWWISQTTVVRRYELMSDARVPVELQSTADVFLFGRSTFLMTFAYEMVNGKPITPK